MTDVRPELLDRVRAICLALPEAHEQPAWIGVRWRIRQRTFAHVFTVDETSGTILRDVFDLAGEVTAVTFRVPPDELDALRHAGYPFAFAGWGRDVMAMHLDDRTDWSEVAELLTDSFCLLAPAKVAARVDRPAGSTD